MPKHLTKKAIAKKLKLPPSTVSYYLENYNEFVKEAYLEGLRHPVYESEVVSLVGDIKKMTADHLSREEIKEELLKNYPINNDHEDKKSAVTTKQEQQTHKLLRANAPQQLLEVLNYQEKITNSALLSLERTTSLLTEKDTTIQQLEEEVQQLKIENRKITGENQKLKRRGIFSGLFGGKPE